MKHILLLILFTIVLTGYARILCLVTTRTYLNDAGEIIDQRYVIKSCRTENYNEWAGEAYSISISHTGGFHDDRKDDGACDHSTPKTQNPADLIQIKKEALNIEENYPDFQAFLINTFNKKSPFIQKKDLGIKNRAISPEENSATVDVLDINAFLSEHINDQSFKENLTNELGSLNFSNKEIDIFFRVDIYKKKSLMNVVAEMLPQRIYQSPEFQNLLKGTEYYQDPTFVHSEEKGMKFYATLSEKQKKEFHMVKLNIEKRLQSDLFEIFTPHLTDFEKALLYVCIRHEIQKKPKTDDF